MDTCLPDGPPTLLLDTAATNCTIQPRAALENYDGSRSKCDRLTCASDNQEAVVFVPCPGMAQAASAHSIRSLYLCDGIIDCPDGSDEDAARCNFSLQRIRQPDQPDCTVTRTCITADLTATVRHGALVLAQDFDSVPDDCISRFSGTYSGIFYHETADRWSHYISSRNLGALFVLTKVNVSVWLLNITTTSNPNMVRSAERQCWGSLFGLVSGGRLLRASHSSCRTLMPFASIAQQRIVPLRLSPPRSGAQHVA